MAKIEPESGFPISNPRMIEIYEEIRDYARHDQPCIFFGASGCGKEYAASYYSQIWHACENGSGPYHRVNCSVLSENIAYSELFGHVKGAFTGAISAVPGLFRRVDKGILFLDEIADLPATVQPMLLRAVDPETCHATPMGGMEEYSTGTVRVLAATDQPREKIRPALLHRLGMQIEIPSLEARPEDREQAVLYFIHQALIKRRDFTALCNSLLGSDLASGNPFQNSSFSPFVRRIAEALQPLARQRTWPGNFRALRVAIDVALIRPQLAKSQDEFIQQCAFFFDKHAGVYSQPSLLRREVMAPAPAVAPSKDDSLYIRLHSVFQNLKDTELYMWVQWFRQHPEQMFSRADLEPAFSPLGYRALLNRLSALVKAGELEQCGPKKQYYRLVPARETMPVCKKHPEAFLALPAAHDESLVLPEAVAALVSLLSQAPHVYLGGPDLCGKTPTALVLGKRLSGERAVYYHLLDHEGLTLFFNLLIGRLKSEKLLQPDDHPELLPASEQALFLTGFLAQFMAGDVRPLMILDHVQALGRQACQEALMNMISHWHFVQFLLVGSKLDLERPDAIHNRIVEYTLGLK